MIQMCYLYKVKPLLKAHRKVKSFKKLIVEPSFFQEGTKQFTFNVEGFKEPNRKYDQTRESGFLLAGEK